MLDFVELVERLQRCEVVDVEMKHLIPHLAQHRVLQIEETQLHALVRC